jgi:hypothetical protein
LREGEAIEIRGSQLIGLNRSHGIAGNGTRRASNRHWRTFDSGVQPVHDLTAPHSGPAFCWGCRECGPRLTSPNAITQLELAKIEHITTSGRRRERLAASNAQACLSSHTAARRRGPRQPRRRVHVPVMRTVLLEH